MDAIDCAMHTTRIEMPKTAFPHADHITTQYAITLYSQHNMPDGGEVVVAGPSSRSMAWVHSADLRTIYHLHLDGHCYCDFIIIY